MVNRRDALKLAATGLAASSLGHPGHLMAHHQQPATPVPQTSTGVSMYRGDAARSGEMPGPAPSMDRPLIVRWRVAPDRGPVSGAVIQDGILFASISRGTLFAIDLHTGAERWSVQLGEQAGYPAVVDGTIYVSSDTRQLHAVDAATGAEQWRLPVDGEVTAPVAQDGIVFAGTENGTLYAIDTGTGEERWRFTTNRRIGIPAVAQGTVFMGDGQLSMAAVDAASGILRWQFRTEGTAFNPTVRNGTIFTGSTDGNVYALDVASGMERWRFSTGKTSFGAATSEQTLFVGAGDLGVVAIDIESGSELWRFTTGEHTTSPVLIDDLIVIQNSVPPQMDPILFGIDAMLGTERWRVTGLPHGQSNVVAGGSIILSGAEMIAIGNLPSPRLGQDVVLRAAPAPTGIERGTASAGTEITTFGEQTESNGETWARVSIGDLTGWIPLSAIDPATLPPDGDVEYVYEP